MVFAQQNKVVAGRIPLAFFIKTGARRDIDLTADDRLDALGAASLEKRDRTVQVAVIGDSDGSMPRRLRRLRNIDNAACAVQQAVFAVQMQVYKIHCRSSLLRFFFVFQPQPVGNRADLFKAVIQPRL